MQWAKRVADPVDVAELNAVAKRMAPAVEIDISSKSHVVALLGRALSRFAENHSLDEYTRRRRNNDNNDINDHSADADDMEYMKLKAGAQTEVERLRTLSKRCRVLHVLLAMLAKVGGG